MQQITVKEVRGPLGKGEKKFWAIKDPQGGEFTAFDASIAKLTPGSIIEAEIEVKGKYVNITKWTLIEAGPAVTQQGGGGGTGGQYKRDTEGIRFEYELKAYLQAIERASIEAQTAYNGLIKVLELITISPAAEKLIEKLAPGILKKTLAYAESRLDIAMASKPPQSPKAPLETEKAGGTSPGKAEKPPKTDFKNVGELLTWALEQGINRTKFLEITQTTEATLPKLNLLDAKQALDEYLKEYQKFENGLNESGGAGVK
jgi:hypothetical protein